MADEVLALLGLTWDQAVEKIIARANDFWTKKGDLSQAAEWDRHQADLKGLMDELVINIFDPVKKVHWTLRVAAVIGRKRPAGQIAEVLGASVIDALWGPALL